MRRSINLWLSTDGGEMRIKWILWLVLAASPILTFGQGVLPGPGQTKIDYNTQIRNLPPAGFVYKGIFAGLPTGCATGQLGYVTNVSAGQNIFGCNGGIWTQEGG